MVKWLKNIVPKTNQSNCKVMLKNLLLVSAIFIAGNCWASSTMPPPTNLDVYLERSNVLIFQGRFERVVYLARSLNDRLLNSLVDVPLSKLILFPIENPGDKGQQFMEIHSVILLAAPAHQSKLELIKSCAHQTIYVPTNINFNRSNEASVAYRELIGKDVLMLLSKRARYGRLDFPSPLFWQASGDNWNDTKFRPISSLDDVLAAAKKANYVNYSTDLCVKN